MQPTVLRALGLAGMSLAAAAAGAAETAPKKQMFLIHEEAAKPSMVQQYEATAKEFVAMVKANRSLMPHFSFFCVQGDDFHYYFVAPVSSMADVDAINGDFAALMQSAAGPKMMDLFKRGGATMEWSKEWLAELRPDLSYAPAQPALKPEEKKYWRYDWYYVMADKEMEAEALAKDFVAAYKAKNVPDGYDIYKGAVGTEAPLIIVAIGAKDPADLFARDSQARAALGTQGDALFARAAALTRRFESRQAWARPDLEVAPLAAGAMK